MSAATECGYESLPHPPRLLDLAPSDFCLLPLLNEHLRGTQFSSDSDVVASSGDFLPGQKSQDELFYKTGILKLQRIENREIDNKCIEVHRDCV